MIWVANFAFSSGVLIASTTSSLDFRDAPRAAFRPARSGPFQASASTSMPLSFSVGTSGRSGERFGGRDGEHLHGALLRRAAVTEIAGITTICTSPRITAVIACGEDA